MKRNKWYLKLMLGLSLALMPFGNSVSAIEEDIDNQQITSSRAEVSAADIGVSPSVGIKIVQPTSHQVFDEIDNVNEGSSPYPYFLGRYHFTMVVTKRKDVLVEVLQGDSVVDEVRITANHMTAKGNNWMVYDFDKTKPLSKGKYLIRASQRGNFNLYRSKSVIFYIGMEAALKDSENVRITRSANSSPSIEKSTVKATVETTNQKAQRSSDRPLPRDFTRPQTVDPAPLRLGKGSAFSTNSLVSLPVKHMAGQKPVYEFEYHDGVTWRKARSIIQIPLQTPKGGSGQVITQAKFRFAQAGKYRYRVKADTPSSAFSPYREFVVVGQQARSLTLASPRPEKIQDQSAIKSTKEVPQNAAASSLDPANQLRESDSSSSPPKKPYRQVKRIPSPPRITVPSPGQSFWAPATVAFKSKHDAKYEVTYELEKEEKNGVFKRMDRTGRLAAGTYRVSAIYKGTAIKSVPVTFQVKMPIKKQAVKSQPQQQVQKQTVKKPAAQPTLKQKQLAIPQKTAN